jgi:uncharacterized protein involved in exopolysaccharide biosynthesis
MNDPVVETVSLRDLAFIFFKHAWSVLGIVIVTLLGTAIYLYGFHKNVYDVSAKIMVRPAEAQQPPTALVDSAAPEVNYHFDDTGPEIAIFQSHEVVGAVVDKFHLDDDSIPPPNPGIFSHVKWAYKVSKRFVTDTVSNVLIAVGLKERLSKREIAIDLLNKAFVTSAAKDTNVIDLHALLPARENSGAILNEWIAEYQRFRLEIYRGEAGSNFFGQQALAARQKLTQAEDSLRTFDDTYKLSDPAREEQILLDEIARAEGALEDTQIAARQVDDRLEAFQREQSHPDPQFLVMASPERDSLLGSILLDLENLERERDKLRLTDLDSSERMQNNRAQFRELLASAVAHLQSIAKQRHDEVADRAQAVAALHERLSIVHDKQTDQSRLRRDVSVDETEYTFVQKRYQEAQADAGLRAANVGDVVVVSSAVDPLAPSGTRKSIVFGIALVAGLLVALAWITIAEFFDDGVYSTKTAERVLGSRVLNIPEAA